MLAIKVFSEAIRYLKGVCFSKCGEQTSSLMESDVQWVLTVPSIWEEGAKSFMKKAAHQVRMGNIIANNV